MNKEAYIQGYMQKIGEDESAFSQDAYMESLRKLPGRTHPIVDKFTNDYNKYILTMPDTMNNSIDETYNGDERETKLFQRAMGYNADGDLKLAQSIPYNGSLDGYNTANAIKNPSLRGWVFEIDMNFKKRGESLAFLGAVHV